MSNLSLVVNDLVYSRAVDKIFILDQIGSGQYTLTAPNLVILIVFLVSTFSAALTILAHDF